jgi:hypothetical protein
MVLAGDADFRAAEEARPRLRHLLWHLLTALAHRLSRRRPEFRARRRVLPPKSMAPRLMPVFVSRLGM